MPNKIAFKGFRSGSKVTIGGMTVANWGAVTDPVDPPKPVDPSLPEGSTPWDQPASAGTAVTINVTRSKHRVAPDGVFFDLRLSGFSTNTSGAVYEPSFHDKYVFWDYGEGYTFTAPTQVIAMDAADGSNRTSSRYSRGPLGSHVFRTPGIHKVRVAVLEPASGKWGQGSVDVSVGNADTFYSGSATLFVSANGNYANAPAGAQRFNNINTALTALNEATSPHRIMLERGQTHTVTSSYTYRPPAASSGVSFRIEARQGSGEKPVIAWSAGVGSGHNDYLFVDQSVRNAAAADSATVISGVRFEGPWNARTETGGRTNCFDSQLWGGFTTTVDDCEFDGWRNNLTGTFHPSGLAGYESRALLMNDLAITNWGNYGLFDASRHKIGIMGCRIAQDVDAGMNGTPGNKNEARNQHGPLRFSNPGKTNLWACDLFSNNGWSAYLGSISAIQPAIRWGTDPEAGSQLNMQACAVESGREAISPKSFGPPRQPANVLVEGNLAVAGFQAQAVIVNSFSAATIRNNTLILSAAPKNSSSIGGGNQGLNGFIQLGGGDPGPSGSDTQPIRIYNNTCINLSTVNTGGVFENAAGFSDVVAANNLVHQPNLGSPEVRYAPLTTIRGFTCRYKGYRPNATTLHTAYANPADSASLWVPQVGSSALGAALTEPDASTDFRGNRRPEPPSIGAFEAK